MSKHRHSKLPDGKSWGHHKTGVSHKMDQSHAGSKNLRDYAGGKPEVAKEAESKKDAFKKGGKVMGKKSKARMDKYARGGRAGGSPFSSAKISENTAAHKG